MALRLLLGAAAGASCLGFGAPTALAQGPAAHVVRVGAARPQQRLQLLLPLKARDTALQGFAQAVSTPGSSLYGDYRPLSELAARFGASSRTRSGVVGFLRGHGARDVRVDATWMFAHATMTVAAAERVFATPLGAFASGGARFVAPAAAVRIPAGLRRLVEGVVGLDTRPVAGDPIPGSGLPATRPARSSAHHQPSSAYFPATGTPHGCAAAIGSGGFTPSQYLGAYDYSPLRTGGLLGNGERVAVIEIDGFRYSDLKTFARCFRVGIPALTTYSVGLKRRLPPGPEATLDLEVLDATAPDLAQLEVFETRADTSSVLRAFLAPLLYPNAKPQIISTSIGLCEKFTKEGGTGAIRSAERSYELLASTGVTVVAASGDNGSADCSGSPGEPASDRQLAVDYPASSPFVTGVGGTQLRLDRSNHITRQLVWNDTFGNPDSAGGGGLSHLFTRPSYQKGVVATNRRAVPDVSALADPTPGYALYCSSSSCPLVGWSTVGGTSAAAPLLAGGVALIDQDLHRHRKEVLGFMNPLLYNLGKSNTGVFSDVLAYGNDVGPYIPGGSGKPLGCCTAKAGFDLASGWGSVDLAKLDSEARAMLPNVPNLRLSIPKGQHPVRAHRIRTVLRCSARCIVLSFALVAIQGSKEFEVSSTPHHLPAKTNRSLALRFSKKEERELRSALAHRKKIFAEAYGVLSDSQGGVLGLTPARRVKIVG